MTTNEILFWSLVIVTWGLSMVAAYFVGRDRAFKAANKMIDQRINDMLADKLSELKKQRPIR